MENYSGDFKLVCVGKKRKNKILIHLERSNMFQFLLWPKSTGANRNAL